MSNFGRSVVPVVEGVNFDEMNMLFRVLENVMKITVDWNIHSGHMFTARSGCTC